MTAHILKPSIFVCLSGLILSALCLCPLRQSEGQQSESPNPSAQPPESALKDGPAATLSPGRRPEESAQTLDQMLAQAMDRNPAIVTAKAKIALAQAELNAAQMEVSRQIISLWNQQEDQKKAIDLFIKELDITRRHYQTGAGGVDENAYLTAQRAVIEAQAQLSKIQNELRSSVGQIPPAIQKAASVPPPMEDESSLPMPQGRLAASIRKALDQRVTAEFTEAPITDVVDYLKDAIRQRQPDFDCTIDLEIAKNANAAPITLNLRGTPLSGVLQAIEDQRGDYAWKFVVRDYGLLLTDAGKADISGYLPVRDFMRRVAAEKDDLHRLLGRKVDAKFDHVKIDELLANLLDPAGIQFDFVGNNIRKSMPNTALEMKKASIGSILQTLEEKNEGVQFVVEDESVILTFRDYAQKEAGFP